MTRFLGILNRDITLEVLEFLGSTSPKSLYNFALTTKTLHALSKKFIYRRLQISFTRASARFIRILLKQLLDKSEWSATVAEVRISWYPSFISRDGDDNEKNVELFLELLPRLSRLKKFIWDAQYNIPKRIIKALHDHHSHCRLYTRIVHRDDATRTLSYLRNSPCLYSLIVNLGGHQLQAYTELQNVTSSCRNLKGLAIVSVTPNGDQFQYRGLWSSGLRALEFDEVVGHDTEFTKYLDCSALERLSVNSLSFFLFHDAHVRLRGIRSLRVDRCWSYHWFLPNFKKFLYTCSGLEELDLTGFTALFDAELFEHLGKTLKALKLHEHEDPSGVCRRRVLSDTEIQVLGRSCGRLCHLGLDVAYNGSWPTKTLEALAKSLWFLIHLELNLEMNIADPSTPLRPAATLSSVSNLWEHLWKMISIQRVSQSHRISDPRLRSLVVNVGSFRHISDNSLIENRGLGTSWVDWEKREQQKFEIRLSERDDESRRGIATVKCVELEALRARLGVGAPLNHWQGIQLKEVMARALNGPELVRHSDFVVDLEMVRPMNLPFPSG